MRNLREELSRHIAWLMHESIESFNVALQLSENIKLEVGGTTSDIVVIVTGPNDMGSDHWIFDEERTIWEADPFGFPNKNAGPHEPEEVADAILSIIANELALSQEVQFEVEREDVPLVQNFDPEFEKLLAEEEQIERELREAAEEEDPEGHLATAQLMVDIWLGVRGDDDVADARAQAGIAARKRETRILSRLDSGALIEGGTGKRVAHAARVRPSTDEQPT